VPFILFVSPRSAQLSNGKHRMHGQPRAGLALSILYVYTPRFPSAPVRLQSSGQNRHLAPPWTPCFKRSRWPTPGATASGEREVDRPRCPCPCPCPHRSATEAAKHHHPTSARSLSLPPPHRRAANGRVVKRTCADGRSRLQAPTAKPPRSALAAAALPLPRKVRSLAHLPVPPARIPCSFITCS